jgi:hypothetical protein
LIGALGLVLPLAVYLLAGVRATPTLEPWVRLVSVSAYYYTGAVAMFVGVIFALSLFLFTYPGYENVVEDRVLGTLGGSAAFLVVLFPTAPPNPDLKLLWWREWMDRVHLISAGALFISFILFSLVLFTRSNLDPSEWGTGKKVRNAVYVVCGVVMIVAVAWAVVALKFGKPVFVPETVAVEAFAVSWLVKGEAEQTVARLARRLFR